MHGKKLCSIKKLATKVKAMRNTGADQSHYEYLLGDRGGGGASLPATTMMTPPGSFVVYVGEDRQRIVVPAEYLSHPVFKIFLDKAYIEFGFDQRDALVMPCSVAAFQEVMNAVECCIGRFEFGDLVEEFI